MTCFILFWFFVAILEFNSYHGPGFYYNHLTDVIWNKHIVVGPQSIEDLVFSRTSTVPMSDNIGHWPDRSLSRVGPFIGDVVERQDHL